MVQTSENTSLSHPGLKLVFENQKPLAASELAGVLSALAKDYRRATKGRTLVVSLLETGSVRIILRDALSTVKSLASKADEFGGIARGIREFAALVARIIGDASEHPEKSDIVQNPRGIGVQTVEALVKAAAESQSELNFTYSSNGDDERWNIRLTPVEAVQIRERTAEAKAALKAQQRRLTDMRQENQALPSPGMVKELADNVSHRYGLTYQGAESGTDGQVAAAIVDSLNLAGAGYLLEPLARELESRGQVMLAFAIRAAIKGSGHSPIWVST
jgi:hypothetical protein